MRLHKIMKLVLGIVVLSTLTFAGDVYIVTKYGKTGGIVGAINQTSDLVNGRQICPVDPTPGCDFATDPGYDGGVLEDQTDDTYNGDLLVRTNDVFEAVAGWRWNGQPNDPDNPDPTGGDERVTITGTLPANGWYEYTDIPGDCDPTESSISADKHTIVCVRKNFDKNDAGTYAEDLKFPVRVLGGTPSGTQPGDISFKLEDATGANVSEDDTDGNSLTVTAAPRWNLEKSLYSAFAGKEYDYDGDGTLDKGWIMDYKFYVESDEVVRNGGEIDNVNPIVGNESMGEDATFEFKDVTSGLPTGATLVDCTMNGRYSIEDGYVGSSDPLTCIGAGCIYGDNYPERHILAAKDEQVITCTQADANTDISIKVEHVDATLNHYPTKDYYGRDLPVNRAIAAIGNVRIFIPLESVEKGADGIAGTDDDGYYTTHNKMTEFDPTTPTGNSNFGGDTESEKDNDYARTLYSARGDWSKYYRGTHQGLNDDHGVWAYVGSGYRSGDGMVNKGSEFSTALSRSNSGGTYLSEDTTCDVIDAYRMKIQAVQDNTVYTEIKTSYTGNPEWPFRFYVSGDEGNYTDSNGADGIPYIVEYATGYVDGAAFLPSLGADTTVSHGDAVLTECTDPNVQWTTDFSAASAGTDAQGRPVGVTKVRWRLKPGIKMNPGSSSYIFLNHKIRDKDLVTNAPMNNNDLIVNFATHKFDYQAEWSKPDYKPGAFPGTHSGYNGDRVIYTGAKVRIKKLENRSGAGLGDEVIYTLQSSYTNDTGLDGTGDVKIIDILPKAFTYKAGSAVTIHDPGKLNLEFGEPTIGTCQDAIDANANYKRPCIDGENQVLIWDLGPNVPINAPGIPDLNYTVQVGASANSGENFNTTSIVSSTDGSPITQRTAEIGVNISVPSSLIIVKKTVDNPDYPELRERTTDFKEIWFTMDVRSGYDSDVHNVDIIDIIPFIGDGNNNALIFAGNQNQKRKINTNYHGEMYFSRAKFTAADNSPTECDTTNVKFYYTNAVPGTIDQAPTVSAGNIIGGADSIWCEGTEAGPNGCTITSSNYTFPVGEDGLKAVTAVRAKGANMQPQAICQMWADVKVRNNLKGDNYSNTSGASANEITNPVLSNSLAVPIVGSSLGNRVWYDANKDGIQDAGESNIPGVKVHLLDNAGNPVNDPTTGQPYVVITDANGTYLFDNLNFGEYKVQFDLPAGYAVSPKGASGDNATDSDATLDAGNLTATTDVIALGKDEYNPNVDLGLNTPVISGHIFDDGDGDGNVTTTTPINKPDGTQLYATLLAEDGSVLATTPIAADGTYSFDGADGVRANSKYKVVLSTIENAQTTTLPANWNNTGQQPSNTGTNGNDGNVTDGMIAEINVGTTDVPNNDFGINKKPEAVNKNKPSEMNPGGATQVSVPTLGKNDLEDGNVVPTKIKITELPTNATLYYNGLLVVAGQTIDNYDPAKLTLDPNDGELTAIFKYTVFDKDGQESDPATVTMPFTGVTLSGHVFDDGSGDANINGTPINKPDGTQLYATLLDSSGNVMASIPVDDTGAYAFTGADGVTANTEYSIVLGTTQGTVGNPAPATDLPANWNNADGEQPDNNGTGNDGQTNGAGDGKMTLTTGNTDTNPNNDFGINHKPVANDETKPSVLNPGGNTQVTVPPLDYSDDEDGKPNTITIKTLPANATLYYDGQPVVAGTPIPNFDPTKLTVDPIDGDQTVVFTYTTTDAAGIESDPATVTMPFTGLAISGNIFNDGDGDGDVNGTAISSPDGTQLHATLLDADGVVVATTPIAADGTYSFDGADGVTANTSYTVVLATKPDATTPDLPTNWNNTGENINSAGAGNDGTPDGTIAVSVGTVNIPQIDFAINHKPVANDTNETSQLNPGGTTQVAVPDLNVSDTEDGKPTTITIKDLPANATLYYEGQPVVAGTPIPNFDPTKLTVDPIDGDQIVIFNYTTTDAAGVESDPATVTMPFTGLGISGTIFNDGDGDVNVNGTPISKPSGTQLHATLLAADGTVVATTPIAADGTYSFDGADGVTANTSYTVVLATKPNAITSDLPTNWNNTGENINSAGAGNDGTPDGTITVSVGTVNVPQIDLGINKKPVATDVSKPIQNNPGGNTQVPVPPLNISDNEDGTPTTVTIKTLPSSGTLYYNGIRVTAGQVIPNFDPSKLTVDPNNGNVVIRFNYTTTDAAGVESDPATVTMPFNGDGIITGNVSEKTKSGTLKPIANVTLVLYNRNGDEVARTTTDANGNYRFTVPPGNYYIQQAQPNGYYDVSENEGGADNESVNRLLNTINVSVGVGETDIQNDFVESTTRVGCNCAPTPVLPCALCAQGFYSAHSHNVKDNSAEVHWVDSYYEIAYDIYLNGKFVATVSEDTTRYTFKGLQTGTEYTAVIIANNGYGGKTKQTVKFKTTDSFGWLPAIYHTLSN